MQRLSMCGVTAAANKGSSLPLSPPSLGQCMSKKNGTQQPHSITTGGQGREGYTGAGESYAIPGGAFLSSWRILIDW